MACSKFNKVGVFDIDTSKELGKGQYGIVYLGENFKTKEKVACKKIFLDRIDKEYVFSELKILKMGVRHENIIQILFDDDQDDGVWVVMEYCNRGNLSTFAKDNKMDLYLKLDIVFQCSDALLYLLNLKKKKVIHRDIKPQNILLTSLEEDFDRIIAKISDFGFSKATDFLSTKLGTFAGTLHYMAPEIFDPDDKRKYGSGVDVFALGIVLYYLLKVKVGDEMETAGFLRDAIGNKLYILRQAGITEWKPVTIEPTDSAEVKEVKQLIEQMIEMDVDSRISMAQVHHRLADIMHNLKVKETSPVVEKVKNLSISQPSKTLRQTHDAPTVSKKPAPTRKKVTDKPRIVSSSSTIHKVSSRKLKFDASYYIGFGEDCVILADKDYNRLVKIETHKLTDVWSKDRPQDVRHDSDKYISDSSLICQYASGYPVEIYKVNDLTHQHTYPGLRSHRLRAALPADRILYVNRGDNNRVDVYSLPEHQHITTLTPPQPYKFEYISACSHPQSQWLALVARDSCCLDIYDAHFVHQTRIQLTYEPQFINAVCAVNNGIVIIDDDNASLHMYNWQGDELLTQTRQQLALQDPWIHGVGRTADDCLLLATGSDDYIVKSLHLYQFK